MRYISTRGQDVANNAATAIRNGIARDGGLYVPETVPRFSQAELAALRNAEYGMTAALIFEKYLSGYTSDDIATCIRAAYSGTFDDDAVAPLHPLDGHGNVLELWHGPTSAFKDVALQMLPQLITRAMRTADTQRQIAILVATSGDTGKAALEGFRDVEGTSVTVLFPRDGVSDMQKRQMMTQRGKNVSVISIDGNFDDAQAAAKRIFADDSFQSALLKKSVLLSSANSINWGRLLPQIVYYVYTSVRAGMVTDFVVPTGNFGNILACWYAKRMGAPIGKLICASNANDVLTDFLQTGTYNRHRTFHKTLSPSMDILVSSNLERLLFELSAHDDAEVRRMMNELRVNGQYRVCGTVLRALQDTFWAYSCDDAATMQQIKAAYDEHRYVVDPHTAVALNAYAKYRKTHRDTPAIVVSTASPYKFPLAVYESITGKSTAGMDSFACLRQLSAWTGTPVPHGIAELEALPCLHTDVCSKEAIHAFTENKILAQY